MNTVTPPSEFVCELHLDLSDDEIASKLEEGSMKLWREDGNGVQWYELLEGTTLRCEMNKPEKQGLFVRFGNWISGS